MFRHIDIGELFDEDRYVATAEAVSLIRYVDIGKFLSSPQTWAGIVVCALFLTAAIYVRRYRDET